MSKKTLAPEVVIKRQRRTIIILASIILITGGYLLIRLMMNQELFHPDPQPVSHAPEKVEKYRNGFTLRRKKSRGIYYSPEGFKKYLDSFDQLISNAASASTTANKPKELAWMLGFYWMLKEDEDGIYKHDFCMVPTLVDTSKPNSRIVYDYFDPANDNYYNHEHDNGIFTKPGGGTNPYNEGQLWP